MWYHWNTVWNFGKNMTHRHIKRGTGRDLDKRWALVYSFLFIYPSLNPASVWWKQTKEHCLSCRKSTEKGLGSLEWRWGVEGWRGGWPVSGLERHCLALGSLLIWRILFPSPSSQISSSFSVKLFLRPVSFSRGRFGHVTCLPCLLLGLLSVVPRSVRFIYL